MSNFFITIWARDMEVKSQAAREAQKIPNRQISKKNGKSSTVQLNPTQVCNVNAIYPQDLIA